MVYLDKNRDIPTNSTFMKNVKFIVCTISFGYVSVNWNFCPLCTLVIYQSVFSLKLTDGALKYVCAW